MNIRYKYLACAAFASLTLGLAYAWSLFVPSIEADMGWLRSQTSLVFSINIVCFCSGDCIGGVLSSRFALKKVLIASGIAFCISFFICSAADQVWQLCVFYGVGCGLFTGIAYMTMINNINKWFADRLGFAAGGIMMGFALGSFLLGSLVNMFISAFGWRVTFRCMGCFYLLVLTAMAFILKPPAPGETADVKSPVAPERLARGYHPLQMIRKKDFYLYFIYATLTFSVGISVIGSVSTAAESMGADSSMVVLATGAVAVGNAVSRIISGYVYDRKGRKFVLTVISVDTLISTVLLETAFILGSLPLLLVSFVLVGISYGGLSPCQSVIARDYFGYKYHAMNFGVTALSGGLCSVTGSMVIGLLQTATQNNVISYSVLVFYAVIAIVILLMMREPEDWHNMPD